MSKHGFFTRAVHANLKVPNVPSEPIALPIYQTASFAFERTPDIATTCAAPDEGFIYSRLSNPTVDALERAIADLEGGERALGLASGMAAIHATIVGLVSAGDHVIAPAAVYGGTYGLLSTVLSRFGVQVSFVKNDDLEAWRAAVRPNTKLVWAETIANPALFVPDLSALSELAHKANARLVVDSTFATPYLCRPLEHGADVVVHSASKYLGGHGDLIAGVIICSGELHKKLQHVAVETGGTMSPFVAWLLLRGLKTVGLRVQRSSDSARAIARALVEHPKVKRVVYPGLSGDASYERAQRYLPRGAGGMVAVELGGQLEDAERFMNALKLFKRAGSLGDTHSLAIQPAATSHRQLSAEDRMKAGISDTFVRLSIGLEDPEDLLEDLQQALTQL